MSRHKQDTPPSAQDSAQVGHMRRIAAARLRDCGLEALIDDVLIVVSELLTNAILHSSTTTIGLLMRVDGDILHIAVDHGAPGASECQLPRMDAESGRGLFLVDALTQANAGTWGISACGTWCHFKLPSGGAR
nr:ATP-binding protein [Streptomyces sp. V3I7]